MRNILADYGTRHIDTTEWDKVDEDDPEGVCELLSVEQIGFSDLLSSSLVTEQDKVKMEKLALENMQQGGIIMVQYKGQQYSWLPQCSKRALFWQLHSKQHIGITKLLQVLREQKIYWHQAATEIAKYLSQCICAVKKDDSPRPYTEKAQISARYPLHILALDLHTYYSNEYFTAVCIYSAYFWAQKVDNKESETILGAYNNFCSQHKEPDLISCDNGPEFNMIETEKIDNPSFHPQSNGVLERLHREVGKQCRIHSKNPDEVINEVNTEEAKKIMRNFLNEIYNDTSVDVFQCMTRQFCYNDLVWRHVNRRARAKQDDTFTGPHRVLQKVGRFSYIISSHKGGQRKIQVNLNDIKKLHVPNTKEWSINEKYLKEAALELEVPGIDKNKILLDFSSIDSMVQDIIDKKLPKLEYFVIPDWACAAWYKRLHEKITAEAVKLPNQVDLFLNKQQKPLGIFAWDSWLFKVSTFQHVCNMSSIEVQPQSPVDM